MEADERPPTLHKLKPHHIGLCTLIYLLFHNHKSTMSPVFRTHMYRLVLSEVSEVAQPKSSKRLLEAMRDGFRDDHVGDSQLWSDFKQIDHAMQDIESLNNFFITLPDLFQDKGYAETSSTVLVAPLARRSMFGYFIRRCCMSYFKLDLNGITKLHKAYLSWTSSNDDTVPGFGYEPIPKDMEAQNTVYRTDPDRHPWARADAYDVFEAAQATGDEYMASESLRRFFEQHFHILSDSGYRQQALLNIARMHYIRKQYVATRDLLDETIMLSRTSGDKITLQHAIALLHRLPPQNPNELPMLSEVQPCINPQEILFDISKLLKPESEQPLSVSFERIFEGIGTYDHWTDVQHILGSESEQWGQHAVQSIVWKEAGCEMLASIEESIVMAYTEHSSDDTTRLIVTLNRAYRRAKDGACQEALSMLLQPSVWRGLNVDDFCTWSNEIWHICMLETTRNGQDRFCREYLQYQRPPGEYDPTHFSLNATSPVKNMIRDRLYKVVQMRECDQGTAVVKELLEALWHCEFQGRFALYRIAMILLADIGLEFGMMNWSKKILEEILPQLLIGGDRETKAYGYVTYGRCILATGKADPAILRESVPYFKEAEYDYVTMEMWLCVQDIRYILCRVYNQLGMIKERDEATKAHMQAAEKMRKNERQMITIENRRLWDVVTQVGAALAGRQMDPTKPN